MMEPELEPEPEVDHSPEAVPAAQACVTEGELDKVADNLRSSSKRYSRRNTRKEKLLMS